MDEWPHLLLVLPLSTHALAFVICPYPCKHSVFFLNRMVCTATGFARFIDDALFSILIHEIKSLGETFRKWRGKISKALSHLVRPAKLYIPNGQRLAEGSLPLVSDDIRRPSLSFSLCRKAFTSSYLHRNPITSPPSSLSAPSFTSI